MGPISPCGPGGPGGPIGPGSPCGPGLPPVLTAVPVIANSRLSPVSVMDFCSNGTGIECWQFPHPLTHGQEFARDLT